MGSFGERLRREREMRGISLDEIATATKISSRNLRALEEEKFNQLPGGIFNKGFVRAYAKFLGIDEDQMVAEYVTASSDTESAREQKLKADLSKAEFRRDDEERREISFEPKSQWGTIAVIVLMAVIVFEGYQFYQKRKADRQQARTQAPAVTTPAPVHAAPSVATGNSTATTSPVVPDQSFQAATPTATTAQQQVPTPKPGNTTSSTRQVLQGSNINPGQTTTPPKMIEETAGAAGPIDVKIHANQDSWVSITADGKTIMKGTLAAASEKAVRAKDQVVVVLGNAGGVEVSYNGKNLENLGKGQEVKKITFTPTGYE